MCQELIDAMAAVEADDTLKLTVFRGAGATLCGGADVHERKGATAAWVRQRRMLANAAYDAIQRCTRPCLTVAHGSVVGSGCGIMLMSDFVVSTSDARFRFPEAAIGSVGATQHLPRIVGKAMAKELLFTARWFDAEEAQRIRLVNHLFGAETLETGVKAIIDAIVATPQRSLSLLKRSMEAEIRDVQLRGFEDEFAMPDADDVVLGKRHVP
jgi:enoyl-CoA hydratase/carnithine racemase